MQLTRVTFGEKELRFGGLTSSDQGTVRGNLTILHGIPTHREVASLSADQRFFCEACPTSNKDMAELFRVDDHDAFLKLKIQTEGDGRTRYVWYRGAKDAAEIPVMAVSVQAAD